MNIKKVMLHSIFIILLLILSTIIVFVWVETKNNNWIKIVITVMSSISILAIIIIGIVDYIVKDYYHFNEELIKILLLKYDITKYKKIKVIEKQNEISIEIN